MCCRPNVCRPNVLSPQNVRRPNDCRPYTAVLHDIFKSSLDTVNMTKAPVTCELAPFKWTN